MSIYDYNYFCKINGNIYDPVLQDISLSGTTPPSGQLLHKMSVWYININCSLFVFNM